MKNKIFCSDYNYYEKRIMITKRYRNDEYLIY